MLGFDEPRYPIPPYRISKCRRESKTGVAATLDPVSPLLLPTLAHFLGSGGGGFRGQVPFLQPVQT